MDVVTFVVTKMASLRRKPRSPYFFACFTGPDGRRRQISTKCSERKKAQAIAERFEQAAKLGAEGRLAQMQAQRIVSEIYQVTSGETLPAASARKFLLDWAQSRQVDTAPRTGQAYSQVARAFITSLGAKADKDLTMVTKGDVANFRNEVAKRTSVANANKHHKYLRIALGAAVKEGFLQDNPAAKLDILKRNRANEVERRPFTVEELKAVLANASGEWQGLVKFGLYTGQRLKDIARLTWSNVDLEKKELRFTTSKTSKRMHLSLAAPLCEYLQDLPAGDEPAAPLFPLSAKIAHNQNGDSRLSHQFHAILVSCGLAKPRTKAATGKGRSLKRNLNELSFHSLRHTATSLFKNAGVPESVVMAIIGHESKSISREYTHVPIDTMREAMEKLPKLPSTTSSKPMA
jgi:integrase